LKPSTSKRSKLRLRRWKKRKLRLNELFNEDINKFLIYCKKSLSCVIDFLSDSVLAAGHVIEKYHLSVLFALNFFTIRAVSGLFSRVDVNDFSISLISE
jgi:hypothetical protein